MFGIRMCDVQYELHFSRCFFNQIQLISPRIIRNKSAAKKHSTDVDERRKLIFPVLLYDGPG